jgi:hypothetical protein
MARPPVAMTSDSSLAVYQAYRCANQRGLTTGESITDTHRSEHTSIFLTTINGTPTNAGVETGERSIMNRGGGGQYARGGYNNRYSSRGRGRGGASRGAPRSSAPRGVFADGIWHCDCTPRLPAEHFKVKKESKNQGRWFYTCQNQEPQRCGFFLWDEDAKVREEGAVLNNSRSEPKSRQAPTAQDGWDAGRSRGGMFAGIDPTAKITDINSKMVDDESTEDESPPPVYSSQQQNNGGIKRKADTANIDDDHDSNDDELLPWPLTGQEEQDLIDAADSVAPPPPETPRKAIKTGVYATPATTVEKKRTLPWLQDSTNASDRSRTPSALSHHHTDHLDSPSKQFTKTLPPIPEQSYSPTPTLQASMRDTPSNFSSAQGRYKDAFANPADSVSPLVTEALAALAGTFMPEDVLTTLRGILSKHDLKSQGVVKGRDISRLALKAKEAKIAELQARVATLEAERELDRGVIRSLRWEGEHGVHEGAVGEE